MSKRSNDSEQRIADLERRLAEPERGPELNRPPTEAVNRPAVTPEQVHNVGFSEVPRYQRGYRQDEVVAFLGRVEATLRDPTATGGVSTRDVRYPGFSKPPLGERGYDADEVDAFLDLVRAELIRRLPGQRTDETLRCRLYRFGGWSKSPVLVIDVDKDAIRVIDPNSNALVASAPLTQVTATPAAHRYGDVLVVGVPGLPPLTIRSASEGFSGRTVAKAKKPDYMATDAEWLGLVKKLGVNPPHVDAPNPSTARKIVMFVPGILLNPKGYDPKTRGTLWHFFLVFGLALFVFGCIQGNLAGIGFGVISLIAAAVAWYFGWEEPHD